MRRYERLTPEQLAERSALIERFAIAIYETVWAEIENSPPELLCGDNGTPYSLNGGELLDRMAVAARDAAAAKLKDWL